jgi:hypothetical protein
MTPRRNQKEHGDYVRKAHLFFQKQTKGAASAAPFYFVV